MHGECAGDAQTQAGVSRAPHGSRRGHRDWGHGGGETRPSCCEPLVLRYLDLVKAGEGCTGMTDRRCLVFVIATWRGGCDLELSRCR